MSPPYHCYWLNCNFFNQSECKNLNYTIMQGVLTKKVVGCYPQTNCKLQVYILYINKN